MVRLALLDRKAHEGSVALHEMPARLRTVLRREIPDLLDYCDETNRCLVVTTDHGMSLRDGKLTHGGGGVFEEAVYRYSWNQGISTEGLK